MRVRRRYIGVGHAYKIDIGCAYKAIAWVHGHGGEAEYIDDGIGAPWIHVDNDWAGRDGDYIILENGKFYVLHPETFNEQWEIE